MSGPAKHLASLINRILPAEDAEETQKALSSSGGKVAKLFKSRITGPKQFRYVGAGRRLGQNHSGFC